MFQAVRAELAQQDQHIRHKVFAKQLAAITSLDILRPVILPPEISIADHPDKYEHVSVHLYQRFIGIPTTERFQKAGVLHGFNVCARLAGFGVRAYVAYGATAQQQGSAEQLGDILTASYKPAVTTFSSLPNRVNRTYETVFGLRDNRLTDIETVPFQIEASTDGLLFAPSAVSLQHAKIEAYRAGDLKSLASTPNPADGRCPASGQMLRHVWQATVATCVINPHLFTADIQKANL